MTEPDGLLSGITPEMDTTGRQRQQRDICSINFRKQDQAVFLKKTIQCMLQMYMKDLAGLYFHQYFVLIIFLILAILEVCLSQLIVALFTCPDR